MEQLFDGIEKPVDDSLFERDDRVLRDSDRLGTDLAAASGDVAVANIVLPS